MRQTMRPAAGSMRHVITSLVVDDSESVRRLLRGLLEAEGYMVHEAADGQAALELLRRNRLRYVVLLDGEMPVLSGWELLYAAEVEGGDLFAQHHFILMTADRRQIPSWCSEFLEERNIAVIEKPISPQTLSRLMADATLRLTAR
ncbi:MAG TPA: response regulator [Ktedonobacterales bacterium]